MVPDEVMRSVAYCVQPDYAKCALFALACRYNGYNNGDLSLPWSEARLLGVSAQWKVYAGLRLLVLAGLIQMTRRGSLRGGRKYPNLYALEWRGINAVDGLEYDAGIGPCLLARNAWARWERPPDWRDTVKQVARANHGRSMFLHSTKRGNGHSTMLGNGTAETTQPRGGTEVQISAPHVVDASKTQGVGLKRGAITRSAIIANSALRKPTRSDRAELKASIARLVAEMPHLKATECARALHCPDDVQLVTELLQEIERQHHAKC
jgi:hypothetical protein